MNNETGIDAIFCRQYDGPSDWIPIVFSMRQTTPNHQPARPDTGSSMYCIRCQTANEGYLHTQAGACWTACGTFIVGDRDKYVHFHSGCQSLRLMEPVLLDTTVGDSVMGCNIHPTWPGNPVSAVVTPTLENRHAFSRFYRGCYRRST